MTVASILSHKGSDIISASSTDTVAEAASLLAERRIGAVPVLDEGRLVGMLSERDIVRGIAIRGPDILSAGVDALMTKSLHTCRVADRIDHVMALMSQRKIRHVPVMDGNQMIGLVSIGDVVQAKIAEAEREAAALKDYIASA